MPATCAPRLASATTQAGTAINGTVSVASSVVAGDLLVALLVNWSTTGLPAIPTGWSSVTTSSASFGARVVTKTALSSDVGGSVSFSVGGGASLAYESVCIAVADPGGSTPSMVIAGIDEQGTSSTGLATTSITNSGLVNLGMVFFATQASAATVSVTDTSGYTGIGVQTFSNNIDVTKATAAVFTHDLTKSLTSSTNYSAGTGLTSPSVATRWAAASMYLASSGGHTYTNYISSAFPLTMII